MKMLAIVALPLLILSLALAMTLSPAQPAGTSSAPAAGDQPPASTASKTGEAVLRDMEAKFAAAVAAKDSKAFLSFWAEDAAIFPPGSPIVVGKDKILANWADILNNPDVSLTWSPDKMQVSASGDLGYTYGKYQSARKGPEGQATIRNGKYVTIWRKEPDGAWRVVVDLGTPSDPPPPAKPAS